MTTDENRIPDDGRLQELLCGARPAPPLPARFQEAVWRRIETGRSGALPPALADRLERWVERLLRPRLALASLALLLAAGGLSGAVTSSLTVKQQALQRYVAAVAPDTLR